MGNKEKTLDFDVEQFKSELAPLRIEYKEAKNITYSHGKDQEEEHAQKRRRSAELYIQLLDVCADAFLTLDDKEAAKKLVKTEVVEFRFGLGSNQALFGGSSKEEFWANLAMRIAEKVVGDKPAESTDISSDDMPERVGDIIKGEDA